MASNDAVGLASGVERHCGERGETCRRVAYRRRVNDRKMRPTTFFTEPFGGVPNRMKEKSRALANADTPLRRPADSFLLLRTTGAYVSERLCFGLRK
jgi:hypothetical protein